MRKLLNAGLVLLAGGTPPAATKLTGAFVGLLKDTINVNIDSDDSVTLDAEANYDGYARTTLGASTVPFGGQGDFALIGGTAHTWVPTGDDTVNTITGQFLVGSDSVSVLAVELFDPNVPLPSSTFGFIGVPIFGFGPNSAGYGQSIITGP
jgi:hypothetical protein